MYTIGFDLNLVLGWGLHPRSIGRAEWLDDERFRTARARAHNARELIALLDAEFAKKILDGWAEVFEGEPDMFWAPVNSPDEILNDPQLRHAGGARRSP